MSESKKSENILIQSENRTDLLEEKNKLLSRGSNQILGAVGIGGILILFSPYIIAVLEDKNPKYVDGMPLPVVLILLAVIIAAWVFIIKAERTNKELNAKYQHYCSTEVLVATTEKVFGSTTKGSLELFYNQIESVRYAINTLPIDSTPLLFNEVFTVRDIVGNEFTFYSFKNCKELKIIIDMQIRSNRNDQV